jgi:chromodomain-helicase-DNA-binding protein 4
VIKERANAEGELEPFDPSAQYIHPLSRVKVKIRISSESRSQSARLSDGEIFVTSEEEDESEESEESEDDGDYGAPVLRTRLPRRAKSTATKELPFSPRKTRSRKVLTSADSEGDFSDQMSGPTRRSMRKVTKINLIVDEDYLDEDEMDSQSQDQRAKSKGKTKANKSIQIKPMYGRIRAVSTIRDDPFPDDEKHEALRRHRDICEKCHQKPAHMLLAAFNKKRSKGNGKKRKRSTDDEFEESEDDQKYINMGGWVTWFVVFAIFVVFF